MTTAISPAERHAEIHFESMVVGQLEHTISTPDFWKTRIRLLARGQGQTIDISSLVDNLTWQDQSSDDLANINTQAAMTGSITVHKPPLRQYKTLAPLLYPGESLSARVVKGVDSFGALGVVVICQVGYGNQFSNVWAMRVNPGYDSGTAETVTLSDGSWTWNLTDDLWTLAQTVADFKYTAGKVSRKHGWRCDQIAHDVCQRYRVPVRTLAQGTAYFSLGHSDVSLTSPVHVITAAYQQETKRTGRTFIIRWGAPDAKHPFGALEVVPMRRNRVLYKFRDQLLDATLTRSQDPGFATVVEARGTLKGKGGKTRKITVTQTNGSAIKRFGFIRKTVNFGAVSSSLELSILAKRALAQRLTPIRTAELNHPGIATIRRGDAIHIDLPEEGYGNVTLASLAIPGTKGKSKAYIAALQEAEKSDPTMFSMANPALAAQAASGTTSTNSPAPDANTPAFMPTSNQGIAFVTTAAHSVAAGSYTMDLTTGFIDVLDPKEVRAQVDKAMRDWKNRGKKTTGKGGSDATNSASGQRWRVTASAEDDPPGAHGACRTIQADGYSELSSNPNLPISQLDFAALGHIPCLTAMKITNPANGRTATAQKQDVGAGSSFLPVMGIYPATRAALGLSGGEFTVIIERVDGVKLSPVRGSPA